MGQQHRKVVKRARRARYLERKKMRDREVIAAKKKARAAAKK